MTQDPSALVEHFTVEKLKQVIRRCSERLRLNVRLSGNKASLLTRVKDIIVKFRSDAAKNEIVQRVILEVHTEQPVIPSAQRYQIQTPLIAQPGRSPATESVPPKAWNNVYNPYPAKPPARPPGSVFWDETPFFRVDKPVSGVVICPESPAGSNRSIQFLTFQLSEDARTKLQQSKLPQAGARYQIRLYMTQYSDSIASSTFKRAVVEFPQTCEALVNSTQLTANLKGIKKQVGTVTPPDITPLLHLGAAEMNKVEFRYINTMTKFVMVANLVEKTETDEIVKTLVSKLLSKDEVEQRFRKEALDSDLVATRSDLSLKCPLSHLRIVTPARSILCNHAQCFDATSFYSLNEQTPAWSCPVCYKKINHRDIIVDGYFKEILDHVDSRYDMVVLNEDFTWQTEDGKVRSTGKQEDDNGPSSDTADHHIKSNGAEHKPLAGPTDADTQSKKRSQVFVLDDDDDEDTSLQDSQRVRKLSPSTVARQNESLLKAAQPGHDSLYPTLSHLCNGQSSSSIPTVHRRDLTPAPSLPQRRFETVDLTLSSDEDEPLASVLNGHASTQGNAPHAFTYRSDGGPLTGVSSLRHSPGQRLDHERPHNASRPIDSPYHIRSPTGAAVRPIHQQYSPNGHRSSSLSRYTDALWEAAVATMPSPYSATARLNDASSSNQSSISNSPSSSQIPSRRAPVAPFSPAGRRPVSRISPDVARHNNAPETSASSATDLTPRTPEPASSPRRLPSASRRRIIQDEDEDDGASVAQSYRVPTGSAFDDTRHTALHTNTPSAADSSTDHYSLARVGTSNASPPQAYETQAYSSNQAGLPNGFEQSGDSDLDPAFLYGQIFGRDSDETDDTVIGPDEAPPSVTSGAKEPGLREADTHGGVTRRGAHGMTRSPELAYPPGSSGTASRSPSCRRIESVAPELNRRRSTWANYFG